MNNRRRQRGEIYQHQEVQGTTRSRCRKPPPHHGMRSSFPYFLFSRPCMRSCFVIFVKDYVFSFRFCCGSLGLVLLLFVLCFFFIHIFLKKKWYLSAGGFDKIGCLVTCWIFFSNLCHCIIILYTLICLESVVVLWGS